MDSVGKEFVESPNVSMIDETDMINLQTSLSKNISDNSSDTLPNLKLAAIHGAFNKKSLVHHNVHLLESTLGTLADIDEQLQALRTPVPAVVHKKKPTSDYVDDVPDSSKRLERELCELEQSVEKMTWIAEGDKRSLEYFRNRVDEL